MCIQRHHFEVISDHPVCVRRAFIDDIVESVYRKDQMREIILFAHIINRLLAGEEGEGIVVYVPIIFKFCAGENCFGLDEQMIDEVMNATAGGHGS